MRDSNLLDVLLAAVPDEPAFVDTRGVLLEGPQLFGDATGSIAVRQGGLLLVAIGEPDGAAFVSALGCAHPEGELVATGPAIACARHHLRCAGERAFLHAVGERGLNRDLESPAATLLDRRADLDALPDEIRREVREVRGRRPIGVVLEAAAVVSICYPVLVTERYWDISIETVEGYRRGGRAAAAFLRLEREMTSQGLEPVWGALESNTASLTLAAKLGFERVGEIVAFPLVSVV